MRATNSTFNDRRRIVVYNPFGKELWQLNGSSLDSEILRLTDYAMENLKKHLKVRHRVKVVKPQDSQEKFVFLLNLAKNPELAESMVDDKKKPKKTTKKAKKVTKKSTKKATKKTTKKDTKVKEVAIEKTPPKKLPRAEPSSVPQIKLATKTKQSTLGVPKGDLDDDGSAVKMVEEFQIAYYDVSGGGTLLIEELEGSISEGKGHESLVTHIKLINDLVKSNSSIANAKEELQESIEKLVDALFTMSPKKPAKKVIKKTAKKSAPKPPNKAKKKTTKKPVKKKSTKKSKKSTKK